MLVLSRKESERIRVGDSIVVTVVRLTKDRVRLGIEAPDDVLVLRDELEKEGDPAAVSEPKMRSGIKTVAGSAPLARKMSAFSNRQSAPNSAVALEEEENQPGFEAPKLRRCPERKFFRCD